VKLTRRHLLAASALVGGTALIGTTGVGLGYRAWWDQPHARNLLSLSDDEAAFADALADAIFPPSEVFPLRGREAGVASVMDEVLQGMTSPQRKLLRLSLHALDQYPRISFGKPFRELSSEEGAQVVAEWTSSPVAELRGIVASVYIFTAMAFSLHPQIAPIFAKSFRCGYGR
jgi:hypothetical protein